MDPQISASSFVRYCALVARHDVNYSEAIFEAERTRALPVVTRTLQAKAAVVAGTTDGWAEPVADERAMASAFLAALAPRTVLGRLRTRAAPMNTRVVTQTQRPVAHWVAQGAPKPLAASGFAALDPLTPRKCAVIVVVSDELARLANPRDVAELQRTLTDAVAAGLDSAFIDPGLGASSSHPGSLTHADTVEAVIESSGSTPAAIATDLRQVAQALTSAGSDLTSAAWVMHPGTATYLAALRATGGEPAFPTMSAIGGTLLGLPVLTSTAIVPSGSPTEKFIALIDADRVLVADEGVVRVEAARHASVVMDDAPSAGAQTLVSLWQNNLRGILIERFISWRALPGASALIANVTY